MNILNHTAAALRELAQIAHLDSLSMTKSTLVSMALVLDEQAGDAQEQIDDGLDQDHSLATGLHAALVALGTRAAESPPPPPASPLLGIWHGLLYTMAAVGAFATIAAIVYP